LHQSSFVKGLYACSEKGLQEGLAKEAAERISAASLLHDELVGCCYCTVLLHNFSSSPCYGAAQLQQFAIIFVRD